MAIESSGAYFIDSDYRVVGVNETAQKMYPQLRVGEKCYQCLMGLEAPCDVCPVARGIHGPKVYLDPVRKVHETVEAVEMPMPDGSMGHALVFSAMDVLDQLTKAFPSGEDELRWLSVIRSLGESYTHIFNLDCNTGIAAAYRTEPVWPDLDAAVANNFVYRDVMKRYVDQYVLPEDRSKLAVLLNPEDLREQLREKSSMILHYRLMVKRYVHFYSVRCIRVGDGEQFSDIILAFACEDDEMHDFRLAGPAQLSPVEPRRKILVVEDNPINREMLVQMLDADYDVLCAEDGETGIEILSRNYRQLALIILDVYMPKCDGFQFLARTRQDPLLSAVPVIVATGSDKPEDEARCLELGAMDFITKPYNLRGIQGRIRNLIKMRESSAMLSAIEFDTQTGLYTRQAFFHHAAVLLNSSPDGTYQAVVVDIHNFKQVNSIYGESIGDDIVRYLAKQLKRLVPDGLVAHFDGDSFVFLERVTDHSMEDLEKAVRGIAKGAPIRNLILKCGIYCCDNASMPVSVICNRAFLALNSIKDDMNHAVARFDDPINQRICRERDMESSFEDAVLNQEFVIWYQPKFDVHTERIVGAEALVRWKKADGSVVSPGEFISLFERDGLIVRLDEYVFRRVCQMQQKLIREYGSVFPISVNLSRNSLHYPGMIERYARIVKEAQISAQVVPIELTESSGMQMIQIKELAQKMVSLGFPLHMDDFGAGYSSLGNLNSLPFHVLKLDKSLVDYIGNYRGNQVLRHIISLAHGLGMEVLAEGVETQEQVQFLREVGCDVIQGYYFSKPLPEERFLEVVAQWHSQHAECGLHIERTLLV